MKQYNTVKKNYSPQRLKQKEGEEIRSKTNKYLPKSQQGYSKIVDRKNNQELLDKYFYMVS